MNLIARILAGGPALLVIVASCGQDAGPSQLNAITDPENRPIQTVEAFWLYENNPAIEQPWTELPGSDVKFFPSFMPTTMRDYFWVTSKSSSVTLVGDRFQRHVEGKIPQIEFPATGGSTRLIFQHDLFNQIDITRADYHIAATFDVSGKVGDTLQLSFTINLVCYKIDSNSNAPLILDPKVEVLIKNVKVMRSNFEVDTYTIDTNMTSGVYGAAKKACDKLGGSEISTDFEINVDSLNLAAPMKIEFPGIFIKHSASN